jgi:hypothetical protein
MIRKFPTRAGTFLILAPALLAACTSSPKSNLAATTQAVAPAPAKPAKPRVFTLDTPVERIAADPQGRAVLERDVPGLMANKEYALFDDMSLSEIALMSGGRLTKSKLALVKSDLIELSCLNP